MGFVSPSITGFVPTYSDDHMLAFSRILPSAASEGPRKLVGEQRS